MRTIQVNVTARDIKTGQAFEPRMCPIAKAVRRATHRRYVRVEGFIEIGDPESAGGSELIPLPVGVDQFIQQFDFGDAVQPFTFSLNVSSSKAGHGA